MLIQAHCKGLLDLGGDVLDPLWWKKAIIVSDFLKRETRAKLYEYKFQFNLALLDYSTMQQTFDLHHRQAEHARNYMVECLMPWVEAGPKSLKESVDRMRETYLERFADPSSPEGQAAVAKQLRKWKERRKGHGKRRPMG